MARVSSIRTTTVTVSRYPLRTTDTKAGLRTHDCHRRDLLGREAKQRRPKGGLAHHHPPPSQHMHTHAHQSVLVDVLRAVTGNDSIRGDTCMIDHPQLTSHCTEHLLRSCCFLCARPPPADSQKQPLLGFIHFFLVVFPIVPDVPSLRVTRVVALRRLRMRSLAKLYRSARVMTPHCTPCCEMLLCAGSSIYK